MALRTFDRGPAAVLRPPSLRLHREFGQTQGSRATVRTHTIHHLVCLFGVGRTYTRSSIVICIMSRTSGSASTCAVITKQHEKHKNKNKRFLFRTPLRCTSECAGTVSGRSLWCSTAGSSHRKCNCTLETPELETFCRENHANFFVDVIHCRTSLKIRVISSIGLRFLSILIVQAKNDLDLLGSTHGVLLSFPAAGSQGPTFMRQWRNLRMP